MSDPVIQGNDPFVSASFSLHNRLKRAIWGVTCLCLFKPSPRFLWRWRSFLLRCFGAELGPGCNIWPNVDIWAPWNLKMGENSCLGNGVRCYCMGKIELGKKVVVSQYAHLCSGTHDFRSSNFQLMTKQIRIEDFVWICTEAFIGPGVTVHEGAVVGACAVVTKDIDAWSINAGNPSRKVGQREIDGAQS